MFRPSALALLATSAALTAPVPKGDKKEGLYFPTTVGAKRVMASKVGDATRETIETVTKVEEKDGVYTVTVESDQGNGRTLTNVFEVSAKGVSHRSINGQEQKTPVVILNLNAKPGDTWEAEVPGPGGQVKRTYTLGKEEDVEVPAGKFKAIRVVNETALVRGPTSKSTLWFAPGVGMVKSVIGLGNRETTYELKSSTAGKEEKKADDKKDEPKRDK